MNPILKDIKNNHQLVKRMEALYREYGVFEQSFATDDPEVYVLEDNGQEFTSQEIYNMWIAQKIAELQLKDDYLLGYIDGVRSILSTPEEIAAFQARWKEKEK